MLGYHEMRARVFDMEEEEKFDLRWLNTTEIPLLMRFTYIADVYGEKLMEEKRKGKMKKIVNEETEAPMSIKEENRKFEK